MVRTQDITTILKHISGKKSVLVMLLRDINFYPSHPWQIQVPFCISCLISLLFLIIPTVPICFKLRVSSSLYQVVAHSCFTLLCRFLPTPPGSDCQSPGYHKRHNTCWLGRRQPTGREGGKYGATSCHQQRQPGGSGLPTD